MNVKAILVPTYFAEDASEALSTAKEFAMLFGARVLIFHTPHRHTDLIIMGTIGLSGLKRFVLGSVAKRIVQLAPCPVLTIKS